MYVYIYRPPELKHKGYPPRSPPTPNLASGRRQAFLHACAHCIHRYPPAPHRVVKYKLSAVLGIQRYSPARATWSLSSGLEACAKRVNTEHPYV